MAYQDCCTACRPLPPQTILRDGGPGGSRCGRCGARTRVLYIAGEEPPEPAGPLLMPHEFAALSLWAFNHPDELEARGLSVAERKRARYWRWLTQTGRVTP